MAIIVRITSADGKKVIAKTLPKLPAHVKVPAGARVDVIDKETGERASLGQYVNAHSGDDRSSKDGTPGKDQITIETVEDFATAEAWLNTMADQPMAERVADSGTTTSDQWYATDSGNKEGELLGYNQNTLIIGGLVGGGAAAGALALSGGGGSKTPKDTIAPAAPTSVALAAADDTGTLTTDGITKNTTGLTITGLAESGSEVEVFDGTTSLGKVTAGSNGSFSLDVTLTEGSHSIRARATDAAGNQGTLSAPYTLVVDTTAPAAPTSLLLAAADDTGTSSTDGITNKTSALTITGSTIASAVVELFDGTTSLGKTTADATGKFTLDVSLAEGTHAITARATDVAGNQSEASLALPIVVDTTAPLPPSLLDLAAEDDNGASNTDNITSKTSNLTISGATEVGARIELFDGTTSLGTVFVSADGTFAKDINLALGQHNITARATDAAGNVSAATSALEITVIAEETSALALFDSSVSHFG